MREPGVPLVEIVSSAKTGPVLEKRNPASDFNPFTRPGGR